MALRFLDHFLEVFVLSMELAACHPSRPKNVVVAPRLSEDLCTTRLAEYLLKVYESF
jgi:hypothetical protein